MLRTNRKAGRGVKTKLIYQNIYGSLKLVKLLEKNQALYEVLDFIPGYYLQNGIPNQIEFWHITPCNMKNKAMLTHKIYQSEKPMVIRFPGYFDDGIISDIELVFCPGPQPTLVLRGECD
jgi:hypothetical protein